MNYKTVYPIAIKQMPTSDESYILMLMVPGSNQAIPVIIGENEAQAIILAHEGAETKRPSTHKLMSHIMQTFDLELEKVTIDRFEEGVFYATLHISDGLSHKHIDSRTSDAVTLALLANCDIEMEEKVIAETAIDPESLTDDQPLGENGPSLEELQQMLDEAEANEDYEQAAEIQKLIDSISKQ